LAKPLAGYLTGCLRSKKTITFHHDPHPYLKELNSPSKYD